MGMDVYGKNATTERGEYFRNNVWWWRPLWDYCETVYPRCGEISGHTNDGDGFDEDEAKKLASILLAEIANGNTKRYEETYQLELSAIEDEVCSLCNGVGIVQVKEDWPDYVEGQVTFRDPCNSCDGKKTKRPMTTWYPFSVENVKEFAEFLMDSGGFEIC